MKSLQLSKPHLLVVIGIPGAGKSAFASKFAETFSAPFIDFAELNTLAGGNETLVETIANYAVSRLLLTGQTLVMDGIGNKLADRKELSNLAQRNGYVLTFIWVQTEPVTAEHRAVHAKTATMSLEQFDTLFAEFQAPTKAEPVIVISGKHTYASQARMVLKRLAGERPTVAETKALIPPSRIVPTRGRFIR